MKKGFTTGSCAAAAAKAAAFMLLSGTRKNQIKIHLPSGETYEPAIEEITMEAEAVTCAVRKDAGDDPDVTNGTLVFAKVSPATSEAPTGGVDARVTIDGGIGVGKVTRPGLDQPVGNAAINSVPRRMIETEVREVMDLFDDTGNLHVEIFVPDGERLAAMTFNPRLGIEGGISIIGTTGIVEPMSTKALLDTIRVELQQKKAMGAEIAVVSPGNYGLAFMKEEFDFDLDKAVKCANFIGDTIDMAAELGFKKMLLCGHIGKLIKVSGGIMNTNSKEADCRMELLAAAAIKSGVSTQVLDEILSCVSTEEAIEIFVREGIMERSFTYIMARIAYYLNKRAAGKVDVRCIVYANAYGLLGATAGALEYLQELRIKQEDQR